MHSAIIYNTFTFTFIRCWRTLTIGTLQAKQSVLCADITSGAAAFPIPAIIDKPDALRASGTLAPAFCGQHFTYADNPGALLSTPAARRLLDSAFPVSSPASIWDGCCSPKTPAHRPSALPPSPPTSRVRRLQSHGTFAEPTPVPEVKQPALVEPGAVPPKNVEYYYLVWFNTPYHRRWHVVATQTREPASLRLGCSTCVVLSPFVVTES